MKKNKIKLAVATVLFTVAGSTMAQELSLNSWTGPAHPLSISHSSFADRIEKETDGKLKINRYVAGSLVPAASLVQGARDGLSDISNAVSAYIPSEMPINNVINDYAFIFDNDLAAAIAVTEFNLLNQDAQAEWAEQGVVFGSGWSTGIYNLACTTEVKSFKDLSGLRVRTAGGTQAEWVRFFGGTPVSLPFTSVYSGLQRGSLDCVVTPFGDLGPDGFRLSEVASSVLKLPMGSHISGANFIYNSSVWSNFDKETREKMVNAMAYELIAVALFENGREASAQQMSNERGLSFIEPDQSIESGFKAFKTQYYKEFSNLMEERRGVPSAKVEELVNDFQSRYDRWSILLTKVDNQDHDALHKLVLEEVFSKIDLETYGE